VAELHLIENGIVDGFDLFAKFIGTALEFGGGKEVADINLYTLNDSSRCRTLWE
jgi:hypothetical protein